MAAAPVLVVAAAEEAAVEDLVDLVVLEPQNSSQNRRSARTRCIEVRLPGTGRAVGQAHCTITCAMAAIRTAPTSVRHVARERVRLTRSRPDLSYLLR